MTFTVIPFCMTEVIEEIIMTETSINEHIRAERQDERTFRSIRSIHKNSGMRGTSRRLASEYGQGNKGNIPAAFLIARTKYASVIGDMFPNFFFSSSSAVVRGVTDPPLLMEKRPFVISILARREGVSEDCPAPPAGAFRIEPRPDP